MASADQEAADEFPDAIKKITDKDYRPHQAFNADGSFLSREKKMPQKTFISKEDKQASEFTAGRDRLTLPFSAAYGFMIRTTLTDKAATPEPLREKTNTSCQSFGYKTRRPGQEPFSWLGPTDAVSLKSGSTLLVRGCLLNFFWYWTMPLAIQNPMTSTPNIFQHKAVKASTCPQTQCL